MRIAWLNRYLNNEEEFRFLKIALAKYKEAYEKSRLQSSESQVLNMIFQINIKLKDVKESKIWLNELYKTKDNKLILKAKEQFDELKKSLE